MSLTRLVRREDLPTASSPQMHIRTECLVSSTHKVEQISTYLSPCRGCQIPEEHHITTIGAALLPLRIRVRDSHVAVTANPNLARGAPGIQCHQSSCAMPAECDRDRPLAHGVILSYIDINIASVWTGDSLTSVSSSTTPRQTPQSVGEGLQHVAEEARKDGGAPHP